MAVGVCVDGSWIVRILSLDDKNFMQVGLALFFLGHLIVIVVFSWRW